MEMQRVSPLLFLGELRKLGHDNINRAAPVSLPYFLRNGEMVPEGNAGSPLYNCRQSYEPDNNLFVILNQSL